MTSSNTMNDLTSLSIKAASNAPEGLVGTVCPSKVADFASLERISFHQELILETIDKIRAKKVRPDQMRIISYLYRQHNIHPSEIGICLNRLIELGAVINVQCKRGESYWNPRKSPKLVASAQPISNEPSISKKLLTAIRSLIHEGGDISEGFTSEEIEQAIKMLTLSEDESPSKSELPPELIGIGLRMSLEREASCGSLAKLLDGRYTLDKNSIGQSNALFDKEFPSIKSNAIRKPSQPRRTRGRQSWVKSMNMATSLNRRPILPAPPGYNRLKQPISLAINSIKDHVKPIQPAQTTRMVSAISMPSFLTVQPPLLVSATICPKDSSGFPHVACGTIVVTNNAFTGFAHVEGPTAPLTTYQEIQKPTASKLPLYLVNSSTTMTATSNTIIPSSSPLTNPLLQLDNTAMSVANCTEKERFNCSEIVYAPETISTSTCIDMTVKPIPNVHGPADTETGERLSANLCNPNSRTEFHTTGVCTRPANVYLWTATQAADWLREQGNYDQEALIFLENEIDGCALMLLNDLTVLTQAKIKLGPAVKIFQSIRHLQFIMESRGLRRLDFP